LAKLSEPFTTKIYNKTQKVFLEGNKIDCLYIIKEGEILLSRKIKSINKFKEEKKDPYEVFRGEFELKAMKREKVS
jgi:CRP-like cAMP-binding protein